LNRALLLALGIALLGACGGGNQGPVAGGAIDAMDADKVVLGMQHYITTNGVRQALLLADTAYFYDDPALIEFRQVKLTIYHASGEVGAILTSDEAELDPRTEVMAARGNVVVVAPEDDQRIETEELHYDPSLDRLWSDHPTTYTRAGRTTRGEGFTSDGTGSNVKITRPSGQIESPQQVGF
jgi:LPS export ABC transporter protein LptC